MIKIIIIVFCMFALAFARHPRVRHISGEQFQQTLDRKLPRNSLITGKNRVRGMKTMMRAREYVATQGCDTHVCFALDTGVFVSQEEYDMQKDFVTLVSAIAGLDERFFVTGTQYGLRHTPINRLTQDVDQFLINVNSSTTPGEWTNQQLRVNRLWSPWSRRAFRHALRFCTRELQNGALSADKIFFLGDVRSPRGGVRHARRFLPPFGNGAMCYVGFRNGQQVKLEKITGDEDDSDLAPDFFEEALDILEDFVKAMCVPNNTNSTANSV